MKKERKRIKTKIPKIERKFRAVLNTKIKREYQRIGAGFEIFGPFIEISLIWWHLRVGWIWHNKPIFDHKGKVCGTSGFYMPPKVFSIHKH